jgi:DNA-binding HxlR family transcriptional regulator
MRQTSFADMHCSLARTLDVIGDWWTPLIIRDVSLGLNRFGELADDLGISRNLLTTRLDSLVENGILERRRYSDHPPRDEYVLTRAGRAFIPVLIALTAWGDRWNTPPGGPPVRFEHAKCGSVFVPKVHCSACGEEIRPRDVTPQPGPGSVAAAGTTLVPEALRREGRGRRRTEA